MLMLNRLACLLLVFVQRAKDILNSRPKKIISHGER
jgi:hypothetical protein